MQASSTKHTGFTIVELVVVMAVAALLTGVVLGTLGDFFTDNIRTSATTTQDTDTRSVLRTIENDLASTSGFSRDLAVSASPLGVKNDTTAWSYTGNDTTTPSNRVLIAGVYATDKASTDDSRMPIFTDTGNGCAYANAAVVQNAYIYFAAPDPDPSKKSSIDSTKRQYNLYRRTIVNTTGGTLCQTPYQRQTCSAAVVAANSGICKAGDALLLSDIGTFAVDYYTSPNDKDPIATQYSTATAADIASMKSIKLSITTGRLINGKITQNTAAIRISLAY